MQSSTPLQNDLEELWSLLNLLEPTKFPKVESFIETYQLSDRTQVEALQKTLKPYLLRRIKEDVEKDLPSKEETVVEVELTPAQKQYYRAIIEKNRDFLLRGKRAARRNMNLINIFMEIRKVCNHPFLIKGAEESLLQENNIPSNDEEKIAEYMISASSKLWVLDKLLTRLFDSNITNKPGNKVLIFSQMIGALDILEDYVTYRNWDFERLDGSCTSDVRERAIDRFEKEENCRIMLLSTRAGGVGLNLIAANVVIIFDSDFNPQNDLQAQARCHRIGQSRNVKVYRLITKNTYERYMMEIASKKLGLEQAVMRNMGESDDQEKVSNADEVEKLLKYGAYYLFMNEDNENETNQNLDIDDILANYSRTVTYTNTFFSTDIDIDDKDFWINILPKYASLKDLIGRVDSVPESEQEKFVNIVQSIVNDTERTYDVSLLYQILQKISTNFNEKYQEWARNIMNERGKRKRRTRLVLDKVEDNGEDGGDYQQEDDFFDESEDFSDEEVDDSLTKKKRTRQPKKKHKIADSIQSISVPSQPQFHQYHPAMLPQTVAAPPIYHFFDMSPPAYTTNKYQFYDQSPQQQPQRVTTSQKKDPLRAINTFIRERQEPIEYILVSDNDNTYYEENYGQGGL